MRKRQMEPCLVRENKKLVKTNSWGGMIPHSFQSGPKTAFMAGAPCGLNRTTLQRRAACAMY